MLPETTRTRIEREADEYAKDAPDNRCFELCEGYIAGATAEAEFNRIAYDELREKAQKMAEALLSAKAYLTGLSSGGGHMFTSIPPIITEIDNALQQWRGEK